MNKQAQIKLNKSKTIEEAGMIAHRARMAMGDIEDVEEAHVDLELEEDHWDNIRNQGKSKSG